MHAVARLRKTRLLDPGDPNAAGALDAHPLVREWFGGRLKTTNEAAWTAAHGRLYAHLRDKTNEGTKPTLADLAPLYQAIAHGCSAGRHEEVLQEIYLNRICRRFPDGQLEFYSNRKLGAVGSDLAAIAWFFEKPYEAVFVTLAPVDQAWVLSDAAFGLRAQGRFGEALPAMRVALRLAEEAKLWKNAAMRATNLSEAEKFVGEVSAAAKTAERSILHADRSGGEWTMVSRTGHAVALHLLGLREEALKLFLDAERRQKELQPEYPLLYSLRGYHYCDLMLAEGDYVGVRDRATTILQWENDSDSLLDRAVVRLALGRAYLGLALSSIGSQPSLFAARDNARSGLAWVRAAIEGLLAANATHYVPIGLLARAAFHRSVGDWNGAARDLDEVEEISEPGPMRLYLCDMALEGVRLAFAHLESFTPLNGLIDDSRLEPVVLDADERMRLNEKASKNLADVQKLIDDCGYHRRDEELAELQAVLRGERKFADLPPRV